MIRNLTTRRSYPDIRSAAASLKVRMNEITDHLNGKIKYIRGCRLIAYKTKKPDQRKKVVCLETGIIYRSVSEAARENGVKPSTMSKHLNGHKRQINGFVYRFVTKKQKYEGDLFK